MAQYLTSPAQAFTKLPTAGAEPARGRIPVRYSRHSQRSRSMKLACRLICAAMIATLLAVPARAQWLQYPTPGVPRLADGSPHLQAPAPRTADGQPDFSGTWEPLKNRPCPADGCADMEVPQEFFNVGWSLKEGLPFQPWAADAKRARMEQNGKDDPVSRCLPGGIV